MPPSRNFERRIDSDVSAVGSRGFGSCCRAGVVHDVNLTLSPKTVVGSCYCNSLVRRILFLDPKLVTKVFNIVYWLKFCPYLIIELAHWAALS